MRTAATDDQKCRALVQATRQLDAYVEWDGYASSTTQALAWPRIGMTDPSTGASIASSVLPQRLVDAVAEQARWLLAGDRAAELDQRAQGVTRIAAGSVELEFDRNAAGPSVVAPAAWALVASWGRRRHSPTGGAVALERV